MKRDWVTALLVEIALIIALIGWFVLGLPLGSETFASQETPGATSTLASSGVENSEVSAVQSHAAQDQSAGPSSAENSAPGAVAGEEGMPTGPEAAPVQTPGGQVSSTASEEGGILPPPAEAASDSVGGTAGEGTAGAASPQSPSSQAAPSDAEMSAGEISGEPAQVITPAVPGAESPAASGEETAPSRSPEAESATDNAGTKPVEGESKAPPSPVGVETSPATSSEEGLVSPLKESAPSAAVPVVGGERPGLAPSGEVPGPQPTPQKPELGAAPAVVSPPVPGPAVTAQPPDPTAPTPQPPQPPPGASGPPVAPWWGPPGGVSAPVGRDIVVPRQEVARQPGEETRLVQESVPPGEEPRLVFNFKFQPWGQVLEWLAEKAGLSLVMEGPPHGTFNYSDRRAYTVSEAIDLINSVLLTKGYVLVRRGQMLILVNLADGVPPNLVPVIPEEELEKRGENELVTTLFSLSRLSVDEAQQEIRSLLGPQGSIIPLPKAQQLLVTDTAGRLRVIRQVLSRADSPEGGIIEAMQIFPLKYVTPDEAIAVLRQLLGIPADQFIAPDGSLRLAVDTVGMRIFAAGRAARIRQVADILQAIDIPGSEGARGVEGALQLEVYEVAPADPQTVLQVMQTLLAGSPGVRLTTDSKTGNLVALARPSEHATIRATLEQLRQQGTRLEVIPLRRLDPQVAATAITKLLAGQDGSASVKVEVDSVSRQLLVRGTERELTLVRSLLEKMGEGAGGAYPAGQGGTVRVLPIYGTQAREVVERLQQIWPTLRGNSLRVIGTPSYIQSRVPVERGQEGAPSGELPSGASMPPSGGVPAFRGGPLSAPSGEWSVPWLPGVGPPLDIGRELFGPEDDRGWGKGWPGDAPPPGEEMFERRFVPLGPPIDLRETPPVVPAPAPAPLPFLDDSAGTADPRDNGLSAVVYTGRVNPALSGSAPNNWRSGGYTGPALAREAVVHFVGLQQEDTSPAGQEQTGQVPDPQAQPQAPGGAPSQERSAGPPPVVIAAGPNGLVIASEDQEALDLLEELVRMISSQVGSGPQLTIFYLKHARADAVAEVLDQVFGGGTLAGSGGGGGGGGMVRELASAAFGEIGGGIVSSLLGGGGGTITPSGTLRITPDTRLNALIVQASPVDLEIIEQLLQVLDQRESPEEVLAQPRPRVIPVRNMQASEVAEIVRQVYQDRLISASGQQARGGPPNPQEFMQMLQALRGGGRGGTVGRRSSVEQNQRLAIGVDTRTNSVIVAAPEPLFQEVKQLIEEIDAAAATPPQATQVVVVKRANPEAVQQAVRAMLGESVTIGRSSPGTATRTGTTGTSGTGGGDRGGFSRFGGGMGSGTTPGGGPPFMRPGFFGGFGGGFAAPAGGGFGGTGGGTTGRSTGRTTGGRR